MVDLTNRSAVDLSNSNNHAAIERAEASERANVLLRLINNYRIELNSCESIKSEYVLEFLRILEKQLLKDFAKEVSDGERDKVKEEYFLLTHKKPFGAWSTDEIKRRIEEEKNKNKEEIGELTEKSLAFKKSKWRKKK